MKKKKTEPDMMGVLSKLDVINQKINRVEIMASFMKRPVKVDPIKLEIAMIAVGASMGCVDVKCADCTDIQQKSCLISARKMYLKSPYWRLTDDDYTNTVLGLLADMDGGETIETVKKG